LRMEISNKKKGRISKSIKSRSENEFIKVGTICTKFGSKNSHLIHHFRIFPKTTTTTTTTTTKHI